MFFLLELEILGILLVDKPVGSTSAKVIALVKRKLGLSKIGHAGTLDPMASGLLVCLIGAATRVARFAEAGSKVYSGKIRLGMTTDTDDLDGIVVKEQSVCVSLEDVRTASKGFLGKIQQVPPRVSAIKVDGLRSYARARRDEEFNLPSREVNVSEFEIIDMSGNDVRFRVECSKGTYIRSIARDLGEKLGCGGCLSALRREGSAPFNVKDAKLIEDITLDDIKPISTLFPLGGTLFLETLAARRLSGGDARILTDQFVNRKLNAIESKIALYYDEAHKSVPLGLLARSDDIWRLEVNFGGASLFGNKN